MHGASEEATTNIVPEIWDRAFRAGGQKITQDNNHSRGSGAGTRRRDYQLQQRAAQAGEAGK